MQEIQFACATLAKHQETLVSQAALQIADADLQRDTKYDNMIVKMEASLSTMSAKRKVLHAENRQLKTQNNKFRDILFGPSSEAGSNNDANGSKTSGVADTSFKKSKGDQPKQPETAVMPPPKTKPRGMGGRKKVEIPLHLPCDKRVIEPENGAICECGCGMRRIGEQVMKRLTYRPAEVRVIEEHYPKYTCRSCERFVQARALKRAFDYTRFDDHLIAGLLVGKFADFLPNYRQEEIFKRVGVKFHRSTMSRLTTQAVNTLIPLYEALEIDIKFSTKLFMDETTMPQLLPGNGRTKTCYAWALCRDDRCWLGNAPPAVVFHFANHVKANMQKISSKDIKVFCKSMVMLGIIV